MFNIKQEYDSIGQASHEEKIHQKNIKTLILCFNMIKNIIKV
jgi:hypothetical protein